MFLGTDAAEIPHNGAGQGFYLFEIVDPIAYGRRPAKSEGDECKHNRRSTELSKHGLYDPLAFGNLNGM
jgi:hypothetical protein